MDPSLLSTDFSDFTWIVAAIALLAVTYLLCFMLPQLIRVIRTVRICAGESQQIDGTYPSVSVIVYANTYAWNLPALVDGLFAQDYPSTVEVVVVNDNSADMTEHVMASLQARYPALHYTFVPGESRNLSRRKLSITLGVKAAHNEVVLLTDGNCRVPSPNWIRNMMRHIAAGKDVVIGYAAPAVKDGVVEGHSRRLRAFDTVWDAVRYLSRAISHKPFRGNGCNLAYRREVFFANKGFSNSLNLNYGDDDIFVNEVTNSRNTAVELSPDSIVEVLEEAPAYMHGVNRLRHNFTSQFLPRAPFALYASFVWAWWIWFLASALVVLLAFPSLWAMLAVMVWSLGLCVPMMVLWRKASKALRSRPILLTMPWMVLWRPVYDLVYAIRGERRRERNYTWGNSLT